MYRNIGGTMLLTLLLIFLAHFLTCSMTALLCSFCPFFQMCVFVFWRPKKAQNFLKNKNFVKLTIDIYLFEIHSWGNLLYFYSFTNMYVAFFDLQHVFCRCSAPQSIRASVSYLHSIRWIIAYCDFTTNLSLISSSFKLFVFLLQSLKIMKENNIFFNFMLNF
jgi:hypothetical protein